MTQLTGTVDTAAKIKDLEEENELLLLQLHQVQEELEVYFLKCNDLEAGRGGSAQASAGTNIAWVDDELPEALAEVERLKTLAQVQAEIKEIEGRNALNVKLGNMLLESSASLGGISKIPFALLAFWRNATSKHIPAVLGGKEFTGVVKAYEERGFVGVKSILKDDGLSPMVKANAYTAVARHLMRHDAKASAEAASKAFEIDPKPYRLKWLACRTHEAGDSLRAEAMLDLLPESITFSDSEAKQVSQIRYEAKNQRQRDARQRTQVVSKQQQVQKQLTELKAQLEGLNKEKAALSQERSALQQEKASLATARDEQAKLAGDRLNQINTLTAEKGQIAQVRDEAAKQLNEIKAQLEALAKEKAALVQERSALQQEKVSLTAARDEQSKLAAERQSQLVSLNAEKDQLVQARDQASQKIVELQGQLDTAGKENAALVQERSTLQQEKVSLTAARDEQSKLAAERQSQLATLNAEKAQLTQARDEQAKMGSQMDLLKAFASELENHINNKLLINAQNIKDSEARICSKLERSASNNAKQIEAFISLQSYLGSNSLLADFHGWPISPDIGLFLLKRIVENQYDLIIEFGSGTSTALLARGLEVKDQQKKNKTLKNSDPATATDIRSTSIVSFEHDTLYYAKTQQLLKAGGLDGLVRLVHAPLVDWRDGEQTYLFYDCQTTLTELAQQYADRQVRILMLVDGPPGITCPNARYPAVPFVFKALGRHQIDVVLDDASRPEEKQVIELWRSFWKQRSFRFAEFNVSSEKGIYLATPKS